MCVSCKEVSGFCFTERLFIFLSNSERKQVGRGHYNNKSFFLDVNFILLFALQFL